MIRVFYAWRNKRRFERLFVAPFRPPITAARQAHARGVRAAQAAQRAFLHQALKGRAAS